MNDVVKKLNTLEDKHIIRRTTKSGKAKKNLPAWELVTD